MHTIYIGYWNDNENRFPDFPIPISRDIKNLNQFDKDLLQSSIFATEHILQKSFCSFSKGLSTCRCCKTGNGASEYTYNTKKSSIKIPEGFLHYLTKHNIEPPINLLTTYLDLVNNHKMNPDLRVNLSLFEIFLNNNDLNKNKLNNTNDTTSNDLHSHTENTSEQSTFKDLSITNYDIINNPQIKAIEINEQWKHIGYSYNEDENAILNTFKEKNIFVFKNRQGYFSAFKSQNENHSFIAIAKNIFSLNEIYKSQITQIEKQNQDTFFIPEAITSISEMTNIQTALTEPTNRIFELEIIFFAMELEQNFIKYPAIKKINFLPNEYGIITAQPTFEVSFNPTEQEIDYLKTIDKHLLDITRRHHHDILHIFSELQITNGNFIEILTHADENNLVTKIQKKILKESISSTQNIKKQIKL